MHGSPSLPCLGWRALAAMALATGVVMVAVCWPLIGGVGVTRIVAAPCSASTNTKNITAHAILCSGRLTSIPLLLAEQTLISHFRGRAMGPRPVSAPTIRIPDGYVLLFGGSATRGATARSRRCAASLTRGRA